MTIDAMAVADGDLLQLSHGSLGYGWMQTGLRERQAGADRRPRAQPAISGLEGWLSSVCSEGDEIVDPRPDDVEARPPEAEVAEVDAEP
jgi:hypothetical protein